MLDHRHPIDPTRQNFDQLRNLLWNMTFYTIDNLEKNIARSLRMYFSYLGC